MGSDTTPQGIAKHISRDIKTLMQKQLQMLEQNLDPKDVVVKSCKTGWRAAKCLLLAHFAVLLTPPLPTLFLSQASSSLPFFSSFPEIFLFHYQLHTSRPLPCILS